MNAAIDRARALYEKNGMNFDADLAEHMTNGIVLSSPLWFLMFKAVQMDGKNAWFVQCAVGDLKNLVRMVQLRTPYISFSRSRSGGRRRLYPTERFVKLVEAMP